MHVMRRGGTLKLGEGGRHFEPLYVESAIIIINRDSIEVEVTNYGNYFV